MLVLAMFLILQLLCLGAVGAALIPIFKEYGGTLHEVMRKNGENNGVTEQAYQESFNFRK